MKKRLKKILDTKFSCFKWKFFIFFAKLRLECQNVLSWLFKKVNMFQFCYKNAFKKHIPLLDTLQPAWVEPNQLKKWSRLPTLVWGLCSQLAFDSMSMSNNAEFGSWFNLALALLLCISVATKKSPWGHYETMWTMLGGGGSAQMSILIHNLYLVKLSTKEGGRFRILSTWFMDDPPRWQWCLSNKDAATPWIWNQKMICHF